MLRISNPDPVTLSKIINQKEVTIGISMIARNEEKNIGNILRDLGSFVDDIVVVDTGSTDGTVEIAKSFGARVFHFKWCDDFSAARNYALDQANTDYIVWLDADDRLSPENAMRLGALKRTLAGGTQLGIFMRLLNEHEDRRPDKCDMLRGVPVRPDIRWEGRVHEQLMPSLVAAGLECKMVPVTINHVGYATKAMLDEKCRRNIRLMEMEENKQANILFHLAASYGCIGDYDNALKYAEHCIECNNYQFTYNASMLMADCMVKMGKLEHAVTVMENILIAYDTRMLRFKLAFLLYQLGANNMALGHLYAGRTLDACLTLTPEPDDLLGMIDGMIQEINKCPHSRRSSILASHG